MEALRQSPLERRLFDIWVAYFEGRITQSQAWAQEAVAVMAAGYPNPLLPRSVR